MSTLPRGRIQSSTAFAAVLHATVGILVALLAWYPGHWLAVLFVLPWLWIRANSRMSAGFLWFAYYATGARDLPLITVRFFTTYGELPVAYAWMTGVACWLLASVLLTLPWALLAPRRRLGMSRTTLHLFAALVAVTLPPLGIIGWLSPVLALSTLSWLTAAALLCLLVCASVASQPDHPAAILSPLIRTSASAQAGIALVLISICLLSPSALPAPDGWRAIDTALGPTEPPDYHSRYDRSQLLQQMAQQAFADGARVVVLPEEITGPWTAATELWWQPMIDTLRHENRTLVIGGDVMLPDGSGYTDSALVKGASTQAFDSRMPMPVALWRPWAVFSARSGTVSQPYATIDGRRVAFSICFEDFLWWPHWRLAIDRPDVLLDLSNTWFAHDLAIAHIQRQSIDAVARVAGVPVLHAANGARHAITRSVSDSEAAASLPSPHLVE